MKLKHLILVLFISSVAFQLQAQDDDPVAYMNLVTKAEEEANQKYLLYISTAAHSGRVKKIEKMRQQAIDGIINSRNKAIGLPFYKGDKALRQSSIDYLNFLYLVFTDDYKKIVNMEDIADQSFNEMQAYLLLQEKTGERLAEATAKRRLATKEFAAKYNINLVEEASENGEKQKKASDVIHYRNKIYLIYFKCNWQWGELNDAMKNNKVNDIEQARNALISYAKEGMAGLDTLKNFAGDPSLANACRHALNQYKLMAEKDIPKMTDYFLKTENFEKVKRSFDAKPQNSRTKEDIDAYNKAVNEMNAGVNTFNSLAQSTNKTSNEIGETYSRADKDFADKHTPYFKK
jgi:uncharacterized lipoprotein YehR (DUF1307 family)